MFLVVAVWNFDSLGQLAKMVQFGIELDHQHTSFTPNLYFLWYQPIGAIKSEISQPKVWTFCRHKPKNVNFTHSFLAHCLQPKQIQTDPHSSTSNQQHRWKLPLLSLFVCSSCISKSHCTAQAKLYFFLVISGTQNWEEKNSQMIDLHQ